MPIYEYGGKQYEIDTTDKAVAKAKILAHLGKTSSETTEAKEEKPKEEIKNEKPKEELKKETPQRKAEDLGYLESGLAAIKQGVESFKDIGRGYKAAFGDVETKREAMGEAKEDQRKQQETETPMLSFKDVQESPSQILKYTEQQILQSAPQMAVPLAAGELAGVVATPFTTPLGGAIIGGAVGIGTYGLQQFGNLMNRQLQEKEHPEELDTGKAATAAAIQAPLGYVVDKFALGIGKLNGATVAESAIKELAMRRAAGEIGTGAVVAGVAKRAAEGGVKGFLAEAPTEALEQVLERWQAGLEWNPLKSEAAFDEYKEAFFGAGFSGGAIGAGSRGIKAYNQYRETKTREDLLSKLTDSKNNAYQEATNYGNIKFNPGATQFSLPMFGQQSQTDGGIEATGQGGMGIPSGSTDNVGAGTGQLNPALNQETDVDEVNRKLQDAALIDAAKDSVSGIHADTAVQHSMGALPTTKALTPEEQTTIQTLNRKLAQINDFVKDIAEVDPNDERITEAHAQAREIHKQIKEIKNLHSASVANAVYQVTPFEPSTNIEAANGAPIPTIPLNELGKAPTELNAAPKQQGLDFNQEPAAETSETSTEDTGFKLAQEGTTPMKSAPITPIQEQSTATQTAKMGMVPDTGDAVSRIKNFFAGLKPASSNENQQSAYTKAVTGIIDEINGFLGESGGINRTMRLNTLNNFFDSLSLAPKQKENKTKALVDNIGNMSLKDQQFAFQDLTKIGNVNTVRGINELHNLLNEAIGEHEKDLLNLPAPAIPFRFNEQLDSMDPFIAIRIHKALTELERKPASMRTPQEQAAHTYLKNYSFAMAMRSGAFDIGATLTEKDPSFFKGQNKEEAELFKEWIEENLPASISMRFNATVEEYKREEIKAVRAHEAATNAENKGLPKSQIASTYEKIIGRQPSGKGEKFVQDAGLNEAKKPGEVKVTKFTEETEQNQKDLDKLKNNKDLQKYLPLHPMVEQALRKGDLSSALGTLSHTSTDPFVKALADRLAGLKLNTNFVFDRQNSLVRQTLDKKIIKQRADLYEFLSANDPKLLQAYFLKPYDIRSVYEGLKEIKKTGNVQDVIGQFNDMYEAYEKAVETLDAPGTYYAGTDTINLNSKAGGLSTYALLHELSHAATFHALNPDNFDSLTPKQQKAVKELNELYEFAKRANTGEYGFTNIYEFVAEAFSSKSFQDTLRMLKYDGTKEGFLNEIVRVETKNKLKVQEVDTGYAGEQKQLGFDEPQQPSKKQAPTKIVTSLWDKFTSAIAKIFGMNNVLGYTLANANAILKAPPTSVSTDRTFNAKQSRSVLGGTLKTNTNNYAKKTSEVLKSALSWNEAKEGVKDFIDNLDTRARNVYLGAFTLRQIADLSKTRLPHANIFIERVENMIDDRNRILNKVSAISKRWLKLQGEKSAQMDMANDIFIDTTLHQIDPDSLIAPAGKTKEFNDIKKVWNLLDNDVKELVRDVHGFFKDSLQEYIDTTIGHKKNTMLSSFTEKEIGAFDKIQKAFKIPAVALTNPTGIKNTENALAAAGYSPREIEAFMELRRVKDFFDKHSLGVYFPLRRFGNYALTVGKGPATEYYLFESPAQRKAKLAEIRKDYQGRTMPSIHMQNYKEDTVPDNIRELSYLQDLQKLVDLESGNTPAEVKQNIKDALSDLYILHLPDQNIRKNMLPRKGTPGMSSDAHRSFITSGFRMAYQQSRYKHAPALSEVIRKAKAYTSGQDPEEEAVTKDYVNELQKRYDLIMNPPDTSRFLGIPTRWMSNVGFIYYMSSMASAVTNILGLPAVALPVISARFGYANTSKTMAKYGAMFIAAGVHDADNNISPSIGNKINKLTSAQQRAFEKFKADGLLDISSAHDLAGMTETPSEKYMAKKHGVYGRTVGRVVNMRVLSFPFHVAEQFNREVMAMSAFDLAHERALNSGYSGEAAFKKAYDTAKELTYKAAFDYSALNKPRVFQSAPAKVILQFKQFAQQMTYLMAKSFHEANIKEYNEDELKDIRDSIRSDHNINKPGLAPLTTDELNQATINKVLEMKKESARQFNGIMGMTFLFGGLTNVWGWGAFSGVMELMHKLFAPDDEEKDKDLYNFDNEFKNFLNENLGHFLGNSVARGVISQVAGVDLGSRLGLNDLWFRDSRSSPDPTTAMLYKAASLAGPFASIATGISDGVKQMQEGYMERGLETMSPALIKNIMKGIRYGVTGHAESLKGSEVQKLSAYQAGMQIIGFTPEALAQQQKANIEAKNAEQKILQKKKDLENQFYIAWLNEDEETKDKIFEKMVDFSSKHPGQRFTSKGLKTSIKNREKIKALATEYTGGIPITKKLINELAPMQNYARDDDE